MISGTGLPRFKSWNISSLVTWFWSFSWSLSSASCSFFSPLRRSFFYLYSSGILKPAANPDNGFFTKTVCWFGLCLTGSWTKPTTGAFVFSSSGPTRIPVNDRLFKSAFQTKTSHLSGTFKVSWNWPNLEFSHRQDEMSLLTLWNRTRSSWSHRHLC